MTYVHFTLPVASMCDIDFMIHSRCGLCLYRDLHEFMEVFWHPAVAHLQNSYMVPVPGNHYGQIRQSPIDGVRYHVWARPLENQFPAVEVDCNPVEEREPHQYPGEWNHRAG